MNSLVGVLSISMFILRAEMEIEEREEIRSFSPEQSSVGFISAEARGLYVSPPPSPCKTNPGFSSLRSIGWMKLGSSKLKYLSYPRLFLPLSRNLLNLRFLAVLLPLY